MQKELETLRLFNRKVERLETTGLATFLESNLPNVTMTMDSVSITRFRTSQFTMTGRLRSQLDNIDQDQIDSFVLTFRLFIQTNDRASLARLAQIYAAEWMPAEARGSFEDALRQVSAYMEAVPHVHFGNPPATRRHLIDTIIYGGLAHSNERKEKEYREWSADGGLTGFMWAEFVSSLQEMLRFLRFFRELNSAVLASLVV